MPVTRLYQIRCRTRLYLYYLYLLFYFILFFRENEVYLGIEVVGVFFIP